MPSPPDAAWYEDSDAGDCEETWQRINWRALDSAKQRRTPRTSPDEAGSHESTLAWAQAELAALVNAHTKVMSIIKKEMVPQIASYESKGLEVPSEFLDSYSWREEFRTLFQWWSSLSAIKFVKMLKLLGPEEDDAFLERLSILIPHPCKQLNQQPLTHEVVTVAGRFSFDSDDIDVGDNWQLDTPPPTFSFGRCFFQWLGNLLDWQWVSIEGMKSVNLSYTMAAHLMEADSEESEQDLAFLFGALMDCRESVFDTVFVNALIARVWRELKYDFFIVRTRDLVLLLCFAGISFYIRQEQQPSVLILIVAMGCNLINVSTQIMFVGISMRMYGRTQGLAKQMSQSGLIILLTEIYTSVTLCSLCSISLWNQLVQQDADHKKCTFVFMKGSDGMSCEIGNHPNFMWMAVALKWLQFSVFLLCTPMMGESALPAFRAVVGAKSVRFLLFLMVMFLGVYQTYYVFPIQDNITEDWLSPLLKIYRLTFLGDFDLWELEGRNVVEDATYSPVNGTITGHLQDPDGNHLYHKGLQLFFVLASAAFTILFMNVYIGLLSEEYSNNSKTARTSTLKLRSSFVFQLLQVRWVLPGWLQNLLGFQHMERLVEEEGIFDGAWVVWDPNLVKVPKDTEQELTSLGQDVDALTETMRQVMRRLNMEGQEPAGS